MAALARFLALIRIGLTYRWRHGRWPSLGVPTRFTELVQLRKLHDRDPRMTALSDKVAAKAYVAARVSPDWITPSLWTGDILPATPPWPAPFVLKSRHGCRQVAFVRDAAAADWPTLRRTARRWLARAYGGWLDEWAYRDIPRGLLVEPFVGTGGALPLDYKLYVFGGRVTHIQVHLDREHHHRWLVLDPRWRPVGGGNVVPRRPQCLAAMIAGAERLAADFDFVRVDLYEIDGSPRFGEMSFYPGSGLDPFDPPALDEAMGALWLDAIAARADGGVRRRA